MTQSDGVITTKNILSIGSNTREVAFDDIDSHYTYKMGYDILICPKGKFHPYDFNNQRHIEKPSGFLEKGDWDLRCYSHETGYFFLFYLLNDGTNIFSYYNNNMNAKNNFIDRHLFDYKLENGNQADSNYEYKFATLRSVTYENGTNYFRFSPDAFIFNKGNGDVNKNTIASCTEIMVLKNFTQATYDNNHYFYYLAYNNVTDFESGYSKNYIDFSNKDNYQSASNNLNLGKNTDSPLNFVDNVEIKVMKFIPGKNYAYYKLYNKDKNKTYFSLISITSNKILYNIEGEFDQFIPNPYSSNSEILAITKTGAYKLCIIKSGDSCSDPCSNNDELILDPDGNKCQSDCDSGKIKMMPEGICINEDLCDENIYTIKIEEGKKECGLCSYFYPNGDKYKLINTDGCINDIPANADYYNKELNILTCKEDYHLNNGECIPESCYETCATCSEISHDINNQKCDSCKEGYTLDDDKNCIIIPTLPPTTDSPSTETLPPSTETLPPTTDNPATTETLPPTTDNPPSTETLPPTTDNPPSTEALPPSTISNTPSTNIAEPTTIIIKN